MQIDCFDPPLIAAKTRIPNKGSRYSGKMAALSIWSEENKLDLNRFFTFRRLFSRKPFGVLDVVQDTSTKI